MPILVLTMKTMKFLRNSYSLFSLLHVFSFLNAQPSLDFETGLVFTGYNHVRIPGDGGTEFSLKDDLIAKPTAFFRLRANYTLKSRHYFSLLYAPLQVRSVGRVSEPVYFQDTWFPAQTELTGDYKFNSYRLTYRFDFVHRPKFQFGMGLTAKIRDARIGLSSGLLADEKVNVGFVPIINFRLVWQMDEKWGLLLDGDALAAPQGRAEDVLVALTYDLNERIKLRVGYRILEGGSDGRSVYNFSLFHYASLGLTYSFIKKKE